MLDEPEVTPEKLAAVANRILHPYTHRGQRRRVVVGVRDRPASVREVRRRAGAEEMATRLPRVFIAGDACHTHSAKAGQGMNVSMADAWNLGWKLASVLSGTARPELLHTYSEERQAVAQELIDFDREFSRLFSARATKSGDARARRVSTRSEFQQYFVAQGRFTAGVATRYAPSMITAEATFQHLAEGFPVGMRFHSAPVIRLADAKPLHLGHVARADGAWRIYIFADRRDPAAASSRARELCEFLASDASPISRFTPGGRRARLRDRRPRDLPAGPSRAGRRARCRRSCCRERASSA